jgi:hypothetical protein
MAMQHRQAGKRRQYRPQMRTRVWWAAVMTASLHSYLGGSGSACRIGQPGKTGIIFAWFFSAKRRNGIAQKAECAI